MFFFLGEGDGKRGDYCIKKRQNSIFFFRANEAVQHNLLGYLFSSFPQEGREEGGRGGGAREDCPSCLQGLRTYSLSKERCPCLAF